MPDHLQPQQLAFTSIAFPKDRTVLYVGEVAAAWRVSDQHVVDLLTEGKLAGFDVAGRHEYVRMPVAAIDALANRFRVPREIVVSVIETARPVKATTRSFWRIPVREGFEAFMRENHSAVR
jgi:hypothetical protein